VAGVREAGGKQSGGFGRVILHKRNGAGESAGVAGAEAGDEAGYFWIGGLPPPPSPLGGCVDVRI
jgi:hypothetical protein